MSIITSDDQLRKQFIELCKFVKHNPRILINSYNKENQDKNVERLTKIECKNGFYVFIQAVKFEVIISKYHPSEPPLIKIIGGLDSPRLKKEYISENIVDNIIEYLINIKDSWSPAITLLGLVLAIEVDFFN